MFRSAWHFVLTMVLVCGVALPSAARSTLDVPTPPDNPLFRFDIFDKGESTPKDADGNIRTSGYTMNAAERQAMVIGTRYWTSLLAPFAANTAPLLIELITNDIRSNNASAASLLASGTGGLTELAAALNGRTFEAKGPYLAQISIDRPLYGDWFTGPMATIPQNDTGSNLPSIVLHEMAHALGILASKAGSENADGVIWNWANELSTWTTHLRDRNGNAPKPFQNIKPADQAQPGDFITTDQTAHSGVYFTGTEVVKLFTIDGKMAMIEWPDGSTAPAVPGLPINAWELMQDDDGNKVSFPEFSHIELQNALMSHQLYRNWTVLMEAELAAMQDVGLQFDRRNLFGFSVYNSDLTYTNTNPYYARTADGQWLVGQPNPTDNGIGLHVYGSRNTLHQAADLLSSGAYGLGIRLDGMGNDLTIDPGVRVQASGLDGAALAVTYGKGHTITHRGLLSATGSEGIGARFDFGDNSMGNRIETRGSWLRLIWSNANQTWSKLANLDTLQGALVKNFDVTGRIEGARAAMFISDNAHVENMNIMRGASLAGDITSKWDIHRPYLSYTGPKTDLITTLRFGLLPDAAGRATTAPDNAFVMRYDGKITGATGLRLEVAGGLLSYNGHAQVIGAEVKKEAMLMGEGRYTLNTNPAYGGGTFVNHGTVAPGNSLGTMTIEGNYLQSPTGTLAVEFDGAGRSDRLQVTGNALVDGTVRLMPLADHYNGELTISPFLLGGTLTGNATSVLDGFASPTLTLQADASKGPGAITVTTSRPAQAYSRYAAVTSERKVGEALDRMAGLNTQAITGDTRHLFSTLDFSPANGSVVRDALPQLAPDAYGHAALAGLERQRSLTTLLLTDTAQRQTRNGNQAFLRPLAGYSSQGGRGASGYNATTFGFMGGFERSEQGWLAGVHFGYAHESVRGQNNSNSRSDALFAGLHGRYSPDSWNGFNLFGLGRLGMDRTRLARNLDLGSFRTSNDTEWTNLSATALLGAGYVWQTGVIDLEPFVALDLAMLKQPSLTEHGGGLNLHVGSGTWKSLRTKTGLRASTKPTETLPVSFQAEVAWNHELLSRTGTLRSTFAATGVGYNTVVRTPSDNSVSASLGMTWAARENLDLSLAVGSEFGGGDKRNSRSVFGDVSILYKF